MPFKILRYLLPLGMLALVTACASDLPAPVPAGVAALRGLPLYLEKTVPLREDFTGQPQAILLEDAGTAQSDNIFFIARLVRSGIKAGLAQAGYTVADDPALDHALRLRVLMFYQPDDWPWANRALHLRAEVFALDGAVLFSIEAGRINRFGSVDGVIGQSGEEMIAGASREITARLLDALAVPEKIPAAAH